MTPKAMDSLDLVEVVMLIEEVFGTEIPDSDAESFGSPREMVDWLERHLSNQRQNKQAADLLRNLAKAHNDPELAEGLEGTWRREQIAAIVRELFRQQGFECNRPISSVDGRRYFETSWWSSQGTFFGSACEVSSAGSTIKRTSTAASGQL